MNRKILCLNRESVDIEIDTNTKQQLINNVEFFEVTDMIPMIRKIVGSSHDSVSWFVHDDGTKYAVINTIFGEDYKQKYVNNIIHSNWKGSICNMKTKRECIKEYAIRNNCNMQTVYCIINDTEEED